MREVVCLRGDYRTVSQECRRADKPERVQVCNEQRCMDKETRDQHSNFEEVDNNIVVDIDEYEENDENPKEENGNTSFQSHFH